DRDDRPLPDRRPGRGLPARRRPRRRGRGAGPRRGRRDPARRHGDRRGDPPGRERRPRRRRRGRRGRDRRVDHARPRRGGADDDRHAAVQHPRRRPRPGGPRRGMTAAPVPAPPAEVLGVPWPGRCLVMGILNVTPDSFSDGGDHLAPESAIARGLELMRDGADLVDVGGESTRPGAAPVPVDVELARVVPVVRALAEHGVPVSVDTTKAAVAAEAVAAGAGGGRRGGGGWAGAGGGAWGPAGRGGERVGGWVRGELGRGASRAMRRGPPGPPWLRPMPRGGGGAMGGALMAQRPYRGHV